jgi:hypothetical protein
VNRRTIDRAVQTHLADWRALLTKQVQDGRELMRQALVGPLRFTRKPMAIDSMGKRRWDGCSKA